MEAPAHQIERFKRSCSRHQWTALVIGLVTLGAALGMFGIAATLRSTLINAFGESAGELLVGCSPGPAVVLLFAGLFWLEQKGKAAPELVCQCCKKFIGGMMHTVIASKHCPFCGNRVLQEARQ